MFEKTSQATQAVVFNAAYSARSTDFSSLNILLVDEDPLQRMLLNMALEELGVISVVEAEQGETALSMLEHSNQVFDIVISDLKMAALGALEFMRLAPTHKMASLILIGGLDAHVLEAAATLCRANGVPVRGTLSKPFVLPQLGALLAAK